MTILIVDDDRALLRTLESALCAAGYHVLTASTAEEACSKARLQKPVHVFLIDYDLRGTTGDKLLEKLMDFHPSARTILMSGYDIDHQSLKGIFEHFLPKPIDLDALENILNLL